MVEQSAMYPGSILTAVMAYEVGSHVGADDGRRVFAYMTAVLALRANGHTES